MSQDLAPTTPAPMTPASTAPTTIAPTPAAIVPRARGGTGVEGMTPDELAFPTVEDLRRRAQRRIPKFAYDFATGGTNDNLSRDRNRAALDAIQIIPRYGFGALPITTAVDLFGHTYAAPIGISPMGLGGLLWPGMEKYLARAAQAANVPYVLATPAAEAIETIAPLAPDVFWFQTYGAPDDDFRMTFDMLRRAERAGAKALLVTIDTPVRAKRPQDMRNRLSVPFKPHPRTILDLALHPEWLLEVYRQGTPKAANFIAYMDRPNPSADEVAKFAQGKIRGGYSWDTIRRLREAWPRALVIKGILHPADAEQAVKLGADGILVSNHGGRTFDGAPPAIEMLPAVKSVAGDLTILLDSGIRSGLDIVRGVAVGAKAVLAGRPFLYSIAAMGPKGGKHLLDLLIDETRMAMGQIGAPTLAAVAQADLRWPGKPATTTPSPAPVTLALPAPTDAPLNLPEPALPKPALPKPAATGKVPAKSTGGRKPAQRRQNAPVEP